MRSPKRQRLAAAVSEAEEDVDDLAITTPQPVKRRGRAAPQDIGIAQLVLGAGGAPAAPLPSRTANSLLSQGLTVDTLQVACTHLAAADERLAPLIAAHGVPERLLAKGPGAFATLSKSICFQQLATSAAAVIFGRVLAACGCAEAGILIPAAVAAAPADALTGAGLSGRKAAYLHDLARHFEEGLLSDAAIDGMTQAQLHAALTAVKGLGPWSVDMFAMFHLGLPDVLPVGDLGVRKGMAAAYGLRDLPGPAEMARVAEAWRPYRSVGSYYMWRVETVKGGGKKGKKKA